VGVIFEIDTTKGRRAERDSEEGAGTGGGLGLAPAAAAVVSAVCIVQLFHVPTLSPLNGLRTQSNGTL
jgi:uncharacterized spore protein YtfJ